jgi:hypothetical protein
MDTKDVVLSRADGGIRLELHWGITTQNDPLQVAPRLLWENLDAIPVGGKRVKIHAPEDLLLILCIHGGKHRWEHLGWLCDVAEIIRARSELDWTKLIDRASSLGGRRILYLGLLLAQNILASELPERVSQQIREDVLVTELAEQLQNWLRTSTAIPAGETEAYYIKLRERRADKLRIALNQLKRYVGLTSRDREVFPFHGRFPAVLYLIRPFRLTWQYGPRPFWRFIKAVVESASKQD